MTEEILQGGGSRPGIGGRLGLLRNKRSDRNRRAQLLEAKKQRLEGEGHMLLGGRGQWARNDRHMKRFTTPI